MSGEANLSAIKTGMVVLGADGAELGKVESIDAEHNIQVLTHIVPAVAIARVDEGGVHLHVGKAAFEAAQPETRG